MGILSKAVSVGSGLAFEAYASKGGSESLHPNPVLARQYSTDQYTELKSVAVSSNLAPYRETNEHSAELLKGDVVTDETEWQLAEASDVVSETSTPTKPPSGNALGPATINALIESFVLSNPLPADYKIGQLRFPVILPQRRPYAKKRGFVHAYAPMLMDCGIDEASMKLLL